MMLYCGYATLFAQKTYHSKLSSVHNDIKIQTDDTIRIKCTDTNVIRPMHQLLCSTKKVNSLKFKPLCLKSANELMNVLQECQMLGLKQMTFSRKVLFLYHITTLNVIKCQLRQFRSLKLSLIWYAPRSLVTKQITVTASWDICIRRVTHTQTHTEPLPMI